MPQFLPKGWSPSRKTYSHSHSTKELHCLNSTIGPCPIKKYIYIYIYIGTWFPALLVPTICQKPKAKHMSKEFPGILNPSCKNPFKIEFHETQSFDSMVSKMSNASSMHLFLDLRYLDINAIDIGTDFSNPLFITNPCKDFPCFICASSKQALMTLV